MSVAQASSWQTLEGVEVECTHCGVRMMFHVGGGKCVRYARCGRCHRWVSSTYTEIFTVDAHLRTHPERSAQELGEFGQVKDRLERWLQSIDDQDPYRVLGVSPLDSAERIRSRFRELALERHPDRGGSAESMQQLNDAYERIRTHRERKRSEALPATTRAPLDSLPAEAR